MSISSLMGDARGAMDGFFGNVSDMAGSALNTIGTDILPNWVGQQLTEQSQDLLHDPTYQPAYGRPSKEQVLQTANTQPRLQNAADVQLFKMGNFSVTGGQVLIMGLLTIGLIVVLKKV